MSGTEQRPVVVIGASWAGMAAAARLAKAGHAVELFEATDRLGGRAAPYALEDGTLVDDLPGVIGFPAPIRDLFRKSGRTLEAELARSGVALVPAGPARLRFADGSTLSWPSDRGEQYGVLSTAYGSAVADRWRTLVDGLDDVWQVVRRLGLELELSDRRRLTRPVRTALRQRTSLATLAEQAGHPHLTAIVRSTAYRLGSVPEQTPAWCAAALSVERTFGRWRIAADDERSGRTSTLVEALADRLVTRKVTVHRERPVTGIQVEAGRATGVLTAAGLVPASAVVAAVEPWQLLDRLVPRGVARRTRRRTRRLRPAHAPLVTHRRDVAGPGDAREPYEEVELDGAGRPTDRFVRAGVVTEHDFRRTRPDPAAGVAWHGFGDWLRRPPITGEVEGLFPASASSPGGAGISAELLSGALASYGVHDLLGAPMR